MNGPLVAGRFEGHVAVVTGAASGIGAATALRLSSEGARVIALDRDLAAASTVCDRCSNAQALEVDVADPHSVSAAFASIVRNEGRIDHLAHIAGVGMAPELKRKLAAHHAAARGSNAERGYRGAVDLDDAEWRRIMSVNLDGTFHCARAALDAMISRRSGSIVTISSTTGVAGVMGASHYSASKAAVRIFTQAIAQEAIGFGVRVNSVAPGATNTPLFAEGPPSILDGIGVVPIGRIAEPAEIAAAITFLLSDDASYIVGETMNVNGGMVLA